MSTAKDAGQEQQNNSLYTALARTATRGIALYFSRPVRLFRPSKVSGWHSLNSGALQSGVPLTPQYISGLVKKQGFMVIPKHFIPPMIVNALLGTVLWTTYSTVSSTLEPRFGHVPVVTAAISGAIAGGVQAVIAAPAENVRLVLEGGSGHGWSHAWQEVFRGTTSIPLNSPQQTLREARQVRAWMREVGDMAGRGWQGWGWGVAKDTMGFAAFFAMFEVTRHVASETTSAIQSITEEISSDARRPYMRQVPRIIHGIALITGGVIAGLLYEFTTRPWDIARKAVQIDRLTHDRSARLAVMHKFQMDGFVGFFRNPSIAHHGSDSSSTARRRLIRALRTLGRVGPWGVGFLVWEACGSGDTTYTTLRAL